MKNPSSKEEFNMHLLLMGFTYEPAIDSYFKNELMVVLPIDPKGIEIIINQDIYIYNQGKATVVKTYEATLNKLQELLDG